MSNTKTFQVRLEERDFDFLRSGKTVKYNYKISNSLTVLIVTWNKMLKKQMMKRQSSPCSRGISVINVPLTNRHIKTIEGGHDVTLKVSSYEIIFSASTKANVLMPNAIARLR